MIVQPRKDTDREIHGITNWKLFFKIIALF